MSYPLSTHEAAEHLRKSKRWLLEWLRKHPRDSTGEPYCTPVGRDKIFHQSDLARIERALRGESCRSSLGRRAPVKRRITKSVAPTSDAEWKRAAELLNDPSLLKFCDGSKSASSSMDNTQSQSQRLKLIQGGQHS